jgi:hypothetical protein
MILFYRIKRCFWKTFADYLMRILNSKDEELTERELEIKKKFEDIKNTEELEEKIKTDKTFKEGLLEALEKLKTDT